MKIHRRFLIFLTLGVATAAAAQSPPKSLAVINGEAITEEQVSKAAEADLQKLELRRLQFEAGQTRDRQDVLERTLNGLIEDKLLTLEASKRKITKEDLLNAEVQTKVAVPTEQEVAEFYEENKARIQAPREDVLPQIGPFLLDQRRQEARAALIANLRKQYEVTSYLDPIRAQLATEGFPTRGSATAPVTIVEFSDFECPFCGNLFPVLKEIETNYAGKVRVIYRQYPLDIHPHAQKAAEASLCANEQDSFWVFHDLLFGNQNDLTVAALKKKAEDLKLNTQAFNTCLDSGKHAGAIRQDIQDGSRAGVSATPAIFINGRLMVGARPYAEVSSMIEDELRRKGVK